MITDSIKRYDIVYYDYGTKPGSDKSGRTTDICIIY